MKKTLPWAFFMALMLVFSVNSFGQGSEDFETSTLTASYANGSFEGADNLTWNYVHARNEDTFPINGKGVLLRRADEPSSLSVTFDGGIGNFSVDTRKAYTGNTQRKLELVINGNVVEQFEPTFADGGDATIVPFVVEDINIEGTINLTLRMYGANGNQQIVLDNLVWTGYEAPGPFDTYFEFSNANTSLPTWFGSNRGMAVMGNSVYVAKQAPVTVDVLDRLTGAHTGTLNVTGIAGGYWPINDIEASADGVLFAANGIINNTGGNFKVYQLSIEAAVEPVVVIDYDVSGLAGARLGDKITVVGSVDDGSAKLYAADAFATLVYVWEMVEVAGTFEFATAPEIITITQKAGSNDVAPLPNGNFYYTGAGMSINKHDATGALLGTIPGGIAPTGTTALTYLGKDGNDEMLAVYHYGANEGYIRVIRIPNGVPASAVLEFATPALGPASSGGNGDVAFMPNADGVNADLYVLDTSDGIAGYSTNDLDLVYPVYGPDTFLGYTVDFTITDENDVAITDAVVTLNGLTNAAGEYVFNEFAPGTYNYSVSADGHVSKDGTVTVVDADVNEIVKLDIHNTFNVVFTVTNSLDEAVTDAVITLGTTTNDAGDYTFADVAVGNHAFSITASGYEVATGTVAVVDADVAVAVELMDELPRYDLTFVVEDEVGTAINDAVVTVGGVANPTGVYLFENMLADSLFNYTVTAPGHFREVGTVMLVDSDVTVTVALEGYDPADPLVFNTFLDKTGDNVPTQIAAESVARGAALYMDRYVVVPSRYEATNVWVWDVLNPHLQPMALDLGTDIVGEGYFAVNYAQTAGDHIYVSNMKTGDASYNAVPFKVYRWTGLDTEPEVVLSYVQAGERFGDSFSIIGDPSTTGSIVAHINSGGEGQRVFKKWNFIDGVIQNQDTPEVITLDDSYNVNAYGVLNQVEGENDLYLTTGNGMGIALTDLSGNVSAYIGSNVVSTRALDPRIFTYEGKRYLIYGVNLAADTLTGARYDIIDLNFKPNLADAMNAITSTEILEDFKVASFVLGAGSGAFVSAITDVSKDDNGEITIMTHVTDRGFIVQTTADLPAIFALTLVVDPADSGTVTGEGNYYEGATVPLTATPAAGYQFVNWTEGTTEVSAEASFTYTMPAAATTLTANFEEIPVIDVATLAELRDKPAGDGARYRYTGEAVIVAMDSYRNRKFLQDATAAILIDDNAGVITTEYDLYDVITNVEGTVNVFRNMVQFIPTANPEASTENTPVEPSVYTIDEITADDQAKLVTLENVTFQLTPEQDEVFKTGENYTLTDGTNEFVLRTDFHTADYIGDTIPTDPINVSGVVITYFETLQLVPRFEADIEPYVESFVVTFTVDMTPADNFDPAADKVYITGSMVDWVDPGTDEDNQLMTRVDDSMIWSITMNLEAGDYQYKYFINAGWDGGEWAGDPNRTVTVADDMTVANVWMDLVNVNQPELVAVNLYPNPARDHVNITSGSIIRNLIITDITGKVVYNDIINDTQVRLSNQFRSGIYIVNIQTDEGVIVRKLQIQ